MRWGSRRNGGNSLVTRHRQSHGTHTRNGQGHTAGHHSYPKGHGGGNRAGAITHAPKEWGSKARKEEERLTGLARQAELDAIDEGLSEAEEVAFADAANCWDDGPEALDWSYDDVAGNPYVLVNGEPVDDGPDFCPWCGHTI